MKVRNVSFWILFILVGSVLFFAASNSFSLSSSNVTGQISESPEYEDTPEFCKTLSDPVNVCIDEYVEYDAPEPGQDRPTSTVYGYLRWEFLAGNTLLFFVNTSDIIGEVTIYDPADPNADIGVQINTDHIRITASSYQFAYKFRAYYEPDIVGDTGFVVVFQSQVVNFGSINEEGEQIFYNVDYRNRITLPTGAGIVSFAPDDAELEQVGPDRFSLVWEYRNRELDSKHDPLIIEVTYSFDDIFLQFTKLIYQNQIERQELQNEQNRLDLLNATIQIIAVLAILASLFSILVAYLLAKRKFDPEKQKARELPRRQATNVEKSTQMEIPVKRLFNILPILMLLLLPIGITDADAQLEEQDIQWFGQYEIFEDNSIKLTVEMTIPVAQSTFKIWDNVSNIEEGTIRVEDSNGNRIIPDIQDDFILINNPPLTIRYSYTYSFTPFNNSGMLVFLDRFWLEFYNPNNDPNTSEDDFFKADLEYNVVLPQGAIIYSASPSEMAEISVDPDGRKRVQFNDQNRQIDAFHDAWEVQVSYSFINVFEAIENLDVDYENIRVEQQTTQELFETARDEILIFALLGLIAPLLSFIIAYWVFRKKNIKEIERIQQQQEEQILVESEQIQSFLAAKDHSIDDAPKKAFIGYYFMLATRISNLIKKDITRVDRVKIESELERKFEINTSELYQLLDEGFEVIEADLEVTEGQLLEYAENVEDFLKQIKGD